jgi:RNA polymerase sigma factor (sigma-70 family)
MSPLVLRRLPDEQLGSRLAAGEAAAFDELYRRYRHRLAAYGAQLLGDAASGEDIAQSTLLKAYGALREGSVPRHLRPWLFRIAHNNAIDVVVRRRELPTADLPERTGTDASSAGALVAALAALPERQRHAYVLREVHGLRIDETARQLGLTAPQVEQALFAARNRMAEHLTFGDRLDCVAVRRLVSGPLDAAEWRALKTHLRSCPACRDVVRLRGRAAGIASALDVPMEWLRMLGAGLVGGGAPVAAKVTAVVATATLAAGVPSAIELSDGHAHRHPPRRVAQAPAVRGLQLSPRRRLVMARASPVSVAVTATTSPHVRPVHETIRVQSERTPHAGEHELQGSAGAAARAEPDATPRSTDDGPARGSESQRRSHDHAGVNEGSHDGGSGRVSGDGGSDVGD